MPTWSEFDDDEETGTAADVAVTELEGRTLELRANFIGSDPPDDPQEGQFWVDNTSSPYKLFVYARIDGGDAGWQPVGPLSRLPASINADPSTADDRAGPYEFKALRIENRGALPAAVAGNKGLLVFLTTNGECYVADQGVSGGWKGLLSVTPDASYDTVELGLEGDLGNDATHPPTKATKGVLEGWLFDAINERRTFAFYCPKNWEGASNLKFRIHQLLNQAESAGDDIEWSGEVRTLIPATEKVTKAATALADASTDIGAVADGIDDGGGPFVTDMTIVHDDATNPVSTGCLILVTIWPKTVSGAGKVGGRIVYRVDLAYAQKPRHERA